MNRTTIANLTCEYRHEPLGIDVARPRLGWQLHTDRRGARQTAYQVLVASDPALLAPGQADLWDSGLVETDASCQVAYAGQPLDSRQRAWWLVRVQDEEGAVAESSPSWWEMGLLARDAWQAQWVAAPLVGGPQTTVPCPFLRRAFTVEAPIASGRLYVTALGLHDCTLNGQAVSADALAPGWTDFHRHVRYQTYDITGLLQEGENVLGVVLGDGWYCGHLEKRPRQAYGERPRLLAQLEICYADGRRQVVASDETWRCTFGPLLEADLIMGESYDARLEMPGWDAPGFDDAAWQPVVACPEPGVALEATNGPMIQRVEELTPVADPVQVQGRRWIVDLGQNMVGRVRLAVNGPAGTTVTLRFGEILNPDGTLYTDNLRTARATDHYTLRGGGEETWESRFTFHGFRYVELSGFPGTPTRETITGVVLHSAMPVIGEFACSDPLITQLQHNIQWGQKGNFLDVPTDCPQRDERLGWTGDAQVFARTAAFNHHVAGFFGKWLQDMRDAQCTDGGIPAIIPSSHLGKVEKDGGPAWSDAAVIVPWTLYQCYGDTRLLEEHYDSMVRYLDFLQATSRDNRRCYDGAPSSVGYGDWLALDGSGKTDGGTPKELIGTAFFAYSARLLGRMAAALGKLEDADRYETLFARIRQAFIRRFVTPEGVIVGQTQTSYVLALHFDLLPEALRPAAVQALVADIRKRGMHLATGFVGTPYLMHVLTQAGELETAYALLHQTSWPSWLYAVTQGATTIWERWDGWTHDNGFQNPGMNSFNHYAYGAIGDWLYSTVAGIDTDPAQPGYRHLLLRPQPGGALTAAHGALATAFGRVISDWRIEDGRFIWDVVVPPNTTATAFLPTRDAEGVTENGIRAGQAPGVTFVRQEGATAVFSLAAGRYQFTCHLPVAVPATV